MMYGEKLIECLRRGHYIILHIIKNIINKLNIISLFVFKNKNIFKLPQQIYGKH